MTTRGERVEVGDALRIERVAVERLDGISGPYALDDFAPGINLIVGPNASGKSRTSVALQSLLWPRSAPARSALAGRIAVGDETWDVQVDDQDARYTRAGAVVDGPSLGGIPREQSDRYLLTLHDLIRADNKNFAVQIQRESEGGFDLGQARTALKYPRSAPKVTARHQVKDWRSARSEADRLRGEDSALRTREERLTALDALIAVARVAQGRVTLLERALQYLDAREVRNRCRVAREQFPEPVGRMTGEEPAVVADLETRRDTLLLQRRDAERRRDEARADLLATGLAEGIPHQDMLNELRDRARALRALESSRAGASTTIAELRPHLERARTRLGASLDDDQLNELEIDGLHELVAATRKAVAAESAYSAQRAMYDWVGAVRSPENIDALRAGVESLSRRLQVVGRDAAQSPRGLVQLTLILAAAVIVIEAVVLGFEVAPVWYALALLAVPVGWIAFRSEVPPGAVIADAEESRFATLGLVPPSAWTIEDINARLATLRAELARAEVDAEKAMRWQDLADRREQAERAADDAEAARVAVRESLGVPDVDGDWSQVERLAKSLESWRSVGDDLAREEARSAELTGQWGSLLDGVNATLAGVGFDPATDATALDNRIAALDQRMSAAREAQSRIDGQSGTIEGQLQPQIDDASARIARAYESLGLAVDDSAALRGLSERVAAWRQATDALRDADAAVATLAHGLQAEPALRGRDRLELEADLTETRQHADEHDGLRDERSRILSDIANARRDTRLEAVVDTETKATAALDSARRDRYVEAAQWQLAEFLHARTRDLNRPPVFRAARELFARFTYGAFELEFSGDYTPKFQARNTATGATLDLDHLSSGTRVQLLMAVRIAFIERLEYGLRLPLLLDETLGNTDDIRINAIMDVTIELSRRGRQIIYFTAQREEIAKWQARLIAAGVTHRVFDLAEIRDIAAADQPVELAWESAMFTRKATPEHLDHAAGREFFRVPSIDPWLRTLDAAHVWYFFPDIPVLAKLNEYGVSTWGQYVALRRRTLTPLIADLAAVHGRAELRHRALSAALEFWRAGRCVPIDRHVLGNSHTLTPSTRESVLAAAEEVEWDGPRLVALLRERRIPHFHESRIERLEVFLRQHEHIVDGEPHPDRVVRAHALAAVEGDLPVEEVDALLRALGMRFDE